MANVDNLVQALLYATLSIEEQATVLQVILKSPGI